MKIVMIAQGELRKFLEPVVQAHEPPLNLVNLDSLIPAWQKYMRAGIGKAYGLITDTDQPAGFLLSLNPPDLIGTEKFATEYLWMVSPKYRSGCGALKLLRQFEDDAKAEKCSMILVGSNAVHKPEQMRKLYLRLGYSLFSEAFAKKVN